MMFYIPKCGQVYIDLKYLIEAHGGIVVDKHESFTYQIQPWQVKLKQKDYYKGSVYICEWIREAIKNNLATPMATVGNKMIEIKDDYLLSVLSQNNGKKLKICEEKEFTIVEGIKMFQIIM